MKRRMKWFDRGVPGLFLCLLLSVTPALVAADELDESRASLAKIQKQIEETLKGLRSKRTETGALADDLGRLDAETRRLERLTERSRVRLEELATRLKEQRAAQELLEKQLQATETQVRRRLVVLYKTGEVGLVRALLSTAESPSEIAEKYAFLTRMVRHDRSLLTTYRQQMLANEAARTELEALREEQTAALSRQRREQETLVAARRGKQQLLAELQRDEGLLESMLKDLRVKVARLNDLVKKLETEQPQSYTGSIDGLTPQKGRLPWPVSGDLVVGYGTSRHGTLGTLIESNGYEIAAAVGTPVKSIAAGKVLFANSLRGYGKLLIIDHGGKDYTLYAHLARFDKQVGDLVAPGDRIAYSGYEGRESLYFEIRHGGKPLDPTAWLKPR